MKHLRSLDQELISSYTYTFRFNIGIWATLITQRACTRGKVIGCVVVVVVVVVVVMHVSIVCPTYPTWGKA